MPEYLLAGIAWVALAIVLGLWSGSLARPATWVTLAVFAAATVVFDLLMTGLPIVTYGDQHRSGLALGPMPVEDLLYGVALCLVAISIYRVASRASHGRPA